MKTVLLALLAATIVSVFAGTVRASTPEYHEFFVASNHHVYDIWRYSTSGTPTQVDATALSGAPLAVPHSAVSGYYIDNEEFIFFVTSSDHLGVMYLVSGTWSFVDLTSTIGAPAPDCFLCSSPYSNNSTFVGLNIGQKPYLYYVSLSGVTEVWGSSGVWHVDSPQSLSGAPGSGVGGGYLAATPLAAITINSEKLLYFEMGNDHIGEIYNNGAGWVFVDITAAAGGPEASYKTQIAAVSYNLGAHVFYVTNDSHIHQLYSYSGSPWTDTDITATSGTPAAFVSSTGGLPGSVQPAYVLTSFVYRSQFNLAYVGASPYSTPEIFDITSSVSSGPWSLTYTGLDAGWECPIYGYVDSSDNSAHIEWTESYSTGSVPAETYTYTIGAGYGWASAVYQTAPLVDQGAAVGGASH